MATISVFSTQANLDLINTTLTKLEEAKAELEMAVAAGIGGAQERLTSLEQDITRTLQLKNVYFPNGTVPLPLQKPPAA